MDQDISSIEKIKMRIGMGIMIFQSILKQCQMSKVDRKKCLEMVSDILTDHRFIHTKNEKDTGFDYYKHHFFFEDEWEIIIEFTKKKTKEKEIIIKIKRDINEISIRNDIILKGKKLIRCNIDQEATFNNILDAMKYAPGYLYFVPLLRACVAMTASLKKIDF